jgi:hypothetical protein
VAAAGVGRGLSATTLYALSAEVAEPLAGLAAPVRVAPHPNQDSLLALLPAVVARPA